MNDDKLLNLITIDKDVMVGKPVIRGTRITVQYILNLLSHGESIENILEEYKGLNKEDIYACILFAGKALEKSNYYPIESKVS